MRQIKEFGRDAGGWAVTSTVAALAFFVLGIVEHARDKSVSAFALLCISVPLFWVGALVAWRRKHNELEAEKAKNRVPRFNARVLEVFIGPLSWERSSSDATHVFHPLDSVILLQLEAWNEIDMSPSSPKDCILRLKINDQQYASATSADWLPKELPSVLLLGKHPADANMGFQFSRGALRPLPYLSARPDWLVFYMQGMHYSKVCDAQEAEIVLEFLNLGSGGSIVNGGKHTLVDGRLKCVNT